MIGLVLIYLNHLADGFLPDARLYPYLMTLIGVGVVVTALIRVYLGKEPIIDASSGKDMESSAQPELLQYRRALFFLTLIAGFYLGVWLLGFRIAALLFVFSFLRYFEQSLTYSAISAIAGLVMVEVLSRILQLVLPTSILGSLF